MTSARDCIARGMIPLLLACCAATAAGESTPAGKPISQLDEVEVVAKKLTALRDEALAAEDRFFQKFNEINDDDRFDIDCRLRAKTGTRHETRECNTEAFNAAQSDYSSNIVDGIQHGTFSSHATLTPELVAFRNRAAYRKAVTAAFERSPELLELAREREEAWNRYENERRKRLEGLLILSE